MNDHDHDNDVQMTDPPQQHSDEDYEFEDDGEWTEEEIEILEEISDDGKADNTNANTTQPTEQPAPLDDTDLLDDEFDEDGGGWDDDDAGGWGDDAAEFGDINNDDNIMSGAKQTQFEATIPEMTSSAIHSNCDEINMIPLFAAESDLKSRSRIGAMVAIRVAHLTNITADQLEVWGIKAQYPFICFKFEFGPFFLNEAKAPKVSVGMSRNLDADTKLHPFRLSWTIAERLKNSMLTNREWPPDIQMKSIPSASDISDLMESSAKEYAVCAQALKTYHNDVQQALTALLDEKNIHKLYAELPSIAKCEAEFGDVMSYVSKQEMDEKEELQLQQQIIRKRSLEDECNEADDTTKVYQICEMYALPMAAAQLAFDTLGYEEAIDKLMDEEMRLHYAEAVNATINTNAHNKKSASNKNKFGFFRRISKKKSAAERKEEDDKAAHTLTLIGDFEEMIRTHSGGGRLQCVRAENFVRSVVCMRRHNFLLRCLCYGLKVLQNGNLFCMICDSPLAYAGLKPTICSDRFCQWRHDQIGLGFSLSAEIRNRPAICDLLVSMTYSASNAGRIQFFFPYAVRGLDADTENETFLLSHDGSEYPDLTRFDADKFANGHISQPKANVSKLKMVIDLCPAIDEIRKKWCVGDSGGDVLLKKELSKIHCLLYPLLCWVITSNRAHLRKLTDSELITEIDTEHQFALCSATPDREREFQDLREANGSFLAWHGSPFGNWHSILRMGLRNYSKTKHQTNGAAFGNGIYFGRNFQLSWNYCKPGSNPAWKNSRFGTQLSCMALCEVCYHTDDGKYHRKGGGGNNATKLMDKVKSSKTSDWTRATQKSNRWVKANGIYVVEEESHVMTRYFLIFPKKSGYKQLEANSLQGKLPNVVRSFK